MRNMRNLDAISEPLQNATEEQTREPAWQPEAMKVGLLAEAVLLAFFAYPVE